MQMQHRFIRLINSAGALDQNGGITIAWNASDDGVKVSIAACSKNDRFTRRQGRELVTQAFNDQDYFVISNSEFTNSMMRASAYDSAELAILRTAVNCGIHSRGLVKAPSAHQLSVLDYINKQIGLA